MDGSSMKESRPWGSFVVIHEEAGLKIKLLEVLPGMRLSYQSHDHRSERWVVVQGQADITLDDRTSRFSRGDLVGIGMKQKHRVANPGEGILRIVEVQLGDYLGEDDIRRYEDDFGRA